MPSKPLRVLVTGADGQLGSELLRRPWPDAVKVTGKVVAELDITKAEQLQAAFEKEGFDLVVNAGAYTAVDLAESERDHAFAVNEQGPANVARACAHHGAALIHISTDYVFDGAKQTPYVESDLVSPLGAYGESKAAGDALVRQELQQHVILRTAWLFSAHGRNFVKTMARLAAERDELRVVADQFGNPTAASDLAWAIGKIAERLEESRAEGREMPWGTYNCVNSEDASWFDLAQAVADLTAVHLKRQPVVRPITTAEYPTPARRPANSRLDCRKLEKTFGIRLRPWREALAPVIEELYRTGEIPAAEEHSQ